MSRYRKLIAALFSLMFLLTAGIPVSGQRAAGRKGKRAMAIRGWLGTSLDGNWNTVGNWDTGVVPVAGDTVYVRKAAVYSMTTNLDRTGDTAGAGLYIARFEIEAGCTIDVGTSTASLKLVADAVVHYGDGTFYYQAANGSSSQGTAKVIIASSSPGVQSFIGCGSTAEGAITTLTVNRGNVRWARPAGAASPGSVNLNVGFVSLPLYDAVVSIATGSTLGGGTITIVGGQTNIQGFNGGTTYLIGGVLVIGDGSDGNGSLYNVRQSGGLFQFQLADSSGAYILGDYYGYAGTLDASSTSYAKTIVGTLTEYPGFQLIDRSPATLAAGAYSIIGE